MKVISRIFLFPVYIYRYCISPMLGPGKCRYTPSCSAYFEKAVMRFGPIRGSIMGWARIFRCSPFFIGGVDEVPETWSWKSISQPYIVYRKRRYNKDN